MALGIIRIKKLKIHCIIGIYPMEREKQQDIFLDVEVLTDYSKVRYEKDDLIQGMDYVHLAEFLQSFILQNKFGLLEDLLVKSTLAVMREFLMVERINLKVSKSAIKNAECVEAEYSCTRSDLS